MNNTLVILVHGYNVWDGGKETVGKLRAFFVARGIPYILLNYGHFGLFDTRFKNDSVAKRIATAARNAQNLGYKVIAVGHSNGAAILHRSSTAFDAPIDSAVYINPALKKHLAPGKYVRRLDVWHSPSDQPVKWSKWLPAANARPWGEMGAIGYSGNDPRITNHDKQYGFKVSSSGHSDIFDIETLAFFGPKIVETALQEST